MRVAKLIEILNTYDPNAIVVMSKDAEGNGYSPFCSDDYGVYISETTWSGDFIPDEDVEEEQWKQGRRAVCLFPVN